MRAWTEDDQYLIINSPRLWAFNIPNPQVALGAPVYGLP